MRSEIVEKQLLECEKKYWRALKDGDLAAAMQLTDFPCIIAGDPFGRDRAD